MPREFPRIVSVDDHVIEPPTVWCTRLPAKMVESGPRVERSGIASMGNVGGVYSWEEDPKGTPCDFWLFEGSRYPMTRVMAAAGMARDEVTVSPVTFARQVYGCFFSDHFGLRHLDEIGEDNVLFECDYPHADSTWPDTRKVAEEMTAGLTPGVVDKLMRTNAIELFGLGERLAATSTGKS